MKKLSITKRILSAFLVLTFVVSLFPAVVFAAPTIVVQPADVIQAAGSGALFQVAADPVDGTTYQWQVQAAPGGAWTNVSGGSGATANVYTTANVTVAMASNLYRVNVSNGGETLISDMAKLFVRQNASTAFAGIAMHLNEDTMAGRRNFAFQATAAQAGSWMIVLSARAANAELGTNITLTVNGTPIVLALDHIPDGAALENIYVPVTFVEGSNTVSIDATLVPMIGGHNELVVNSLLSADFRTVANPEFSRPPDTYNRSATLDLTLPELWVQAGANIRYTLNGSDPSATAGTLYNGAFRIFEDDMPIGTEVTVKAIAYLDGKTASTIVEHKYIAGDDSIYYSSVQSNRASGSVLTNSTGQVTLSHPSIASNTAPFPDGDIWYTIDGSDPLTSPTAKKVGYVLTTTATPMTRTVATIRILGETTLKAALRDSQGRVSSVSTWNYQLRSGDVTALNFPAGGSGTSAAELTVGKGSGIHLRTATNVSPNTKIFYTVQRFPAGTGAADINAAARDPIINEDGTAPADAYTFDLDAVNRVIPVPLNMAHNEIFHVRAIGAGPNILPGATVFSRSYVFDANTPRLTEIHADHDFQTWKAAGFPTGKEPDSLIDLIRRIFNHMPRNTTGGSGIYTVFGGNTATGAETNGPAWRTNGARAYGIPSLNSYDGPAGIRMTAQSDMMFTRPVTYWPAATARAATWNMELSEEMGKGWGNELSYYVNNVILAPGMNLHRSVLGGRNFEYYSEDPMLSGYQAAAETRGVQHKGDVGVTLKHFMANQHETNRNPYPTEISIRALREVYLRNWQYAQKNSEPWTYMTAFNAVNGVHTAFDPELLVTILRDEWGFKNSVMTDYGGPGNNFNYYPFYAPYNTAGAHLPTSPHAGLIKALNVMSLASGNPGNVQAGHQQGFITNDDLWAAFRDLMVYTSKHQVFNNVPHAYYVDEQIKEDNFDIAEQMSIEGSVLLKNERVGDHSAARFALPLRKPQGNEKILLLGMAAHRFYRGGTGSGSINMVPEYAARIPQMVDAINDYVGFGHVIDSANLDRAMTGIREQAGVIIASGAMSSTGARSELVIPQAMVDQWKSDTNISSIIWVLQRESGENADVRRGKGAYYLADEEQNLIRQAREIADARNIPFVVILNTGTFQEMESWDWQADAILQMWNSGEVGASGLVKMLFGDANPSGKLPTTIPIDVTGVDVAEPEFVSPFYPVNPDRPRKTNDTGFLLNPSDGEFAVPTSGTATRAAGNGAVYREGIFNGYRYFDSFGVPTKYPFGHGLSYTTFAFSNPQLSKDLLIGKEDILTASITIRNSGNVKGKEVVQFYIGAPGIELIKPVKELKAFKKTSALDAGSSETLTVEFDAMSLASFDDLRGAWVVEPGEYTVYFASSAEDIRQTAKFMVAEGFVVQEVVRYAMAPEVPIPEYVPPKYGDFVIYPQWIREVHVASANSYNIVDGKEGRPVLIAMADTKAFASGRIQTGRGGTALTNTPVFSFTENGIKAKVLLALYDDDGTMLGATEQDLTLNNFILSETGRASMNGITQQPGSTKSTIGSNHATSGTTPYTWASAVIDLPQDGSAAMARAYLWTQDGYVPLNDGAFIMLNDVQDKLNEDEDDDD